MTIYCYWHKPAVALAAQVATMPTFPVKSLVLKNFTTGGSAAAALSGMTLLLGSNPGWSDLGRVRVKSGLGSTVNIAWASPGVHDGELSPEVDAYVTVLVEFRVWAKIPRIESNGDVFMDNDLTPSSPVNFPPPVANCGPSEAGTIDPVTGKLQVTLDGRQSFYWGTDRLGIEAINNGDYQWFIGGGQIMSGTLNTSTLVVRFPPGVTTVGLQVSAPSGQTHLARKLLYARDPANDQCLRHQIVAHQATPKGQELDIRFFGDLDPFVYNDGSQIIVWEEDGIYPRRTIFSGWHVSERSSFSHERTAALGESVLHFVDINGRLSQLPGWSLELNYQPLSATKWNETRYNHLLHYFWFILQWQTTALEVCDLLIPAILPYLHFVRLTSDAATIYEQINTLANMCNPDFYLTSSQQGQMLLAPDPVIIGLADRDTFVPNFGTLAYTDWTQVTVEAQRPPRVAELISGAIVSSDTYVLDTEGNNIIPTVWSIAPGKTRGQGGERASNTNRLVGGQYELNVAEGNRYARLNSPWGDIQITMPWQYTLLAGIDPGRMGRLLVVFDKDRPPRPFPDFTIWTMVKQIDITYDYQRGGLVRTVQLTLEMETEGPQAETFERPVEVPI